ncbi:MAG: S8 family serine peptidase [Candidatus Heimdallarchaeota archaeon]|nr:S8 family serine peptidase [Candidatus Heimdallarchaeota archaeon]
MRNKKTLTILGVLCVVTLLVIVPPSINATEKDIQFVDAVVLFKPGASVDVQDVEYKHHYNTLNGFAGKMPTPIYQQLMDSGLVSSIQIDREVSIFEDTLDWGVDDLDAEEVWGGAENAVDVIAGNNAGQGVKVAVLDTGIDYNHVDLDDNYMGGYDYVNNDNYPMDGHGHGTHCAGIIAAEDNEQGVIGVAPEASLYGVKVLSDSGSGTISDIVAGIDWSINNGMNVVSMSLGASSGDSTLQDACNRANNAGIVVVCASGNDYSSSISYPARYSSTIAVGAIDSSHTRASFSNYGSELDVVAPGVDVYSCAPNDGYQQMSGTSMACPMVSGASALILAENSALTAEEVRTILHSTATDLGSSGWDQYYGYGLVNCPAAVAEAGGGTEDTTPPTIDITSPNEGATLTSSDVTVTWSGSDSGSGIDYYETRIDSGSWINKGTSTSHTFTGLADGSHTVDVRAWDVAGNSATDMVTFTVDTSGGTGPPYTFTGTVSQGQDSTQHTFNVPSDAARIEVTLEFSSSYDFDLSLWDDQNRRTGGWTSSDHSQRTNIPNSVYSGYSANPETITVDPVSTSGTWSVGCYAYSGSGSYTITVDIISEGPDTTPPTVDITSPTDGATVSGTITIEASASDNVAVDYVEFYVDGSLLGTDSSSPYQMSLDTTTLSDGSHSITAKAYDTSGNTAEDSITINVDNSAPPSDTMYVYSIEMWYEEVTWWWWVIGYDVFTKITVHDAAGNPLSGVTVDLSLQLPDGSTATGSADTGADGSVTFTYEEGDSGTYTATVTNLAKTGYVYDPDQNVETSETLSVP